MTCYHGYADDRPCDRCAPTPRDTGQALDPRAVEAAAWALSVHLGDPGDWYDIAAVAVTAAEPHLTADLVRERNEARGQVEHWERMAKRREEALDALGAERNTWARQMADLNDECAATRRVKDDAEARMRDALNERDDALNRAEEAEAAIARVEALLSDDWGALDDDGERCSVCRRKWSKHGDAADAHYLGADALRTFAADIRAALRGDQP